MGALTTDLPKCRTVLHEKELVRWQIEALESSGIDDISIVTGYLRETFDFPVRYFINERWADTNMIRSLMTAAEWLETSGCVVTYSDIIFGTEAVEKLLESDTDIAITYDPNWRKLWEARFSDPLDDAETFILRDGRLVDIGEKTDDYRRICGQFMGLLLITPRGWGTLNALLSACDPATVDHMDVTTALKLLIDQGERITAVPIDGPWYEVDSESDLEAYQDLPAPVLGS
jgi:choline kinase